MRLIRPAMLAVILLSFTLPRAGLSAAEAVTRNPAVQQKNQTDRFQKERTEAVSYLFCYYNNKVNPQKADEYARFVMEAASRYHIDPGLIAAIIVKESRAVETARSKYASGLMQIYWKLHRKAILAKFPHIKSEKILMEPRNNIIVGTWLFSQYMVNCKGNERQALQRYLGANSDRYVDLVMKYKGRYNERVKANTNSASKR